VVFASLAFIYLAILFYAKRKKKIFNSKAKKFKEKLSPMISEFLFLGENATKDEKSNFLALKVELRQMLNDDFNRRILTEVLLDLRKDISGETQEAICQLYQDFGLDKDAYKKLRSWRWQLVCKGIVELTQMKVVDSYGFLCKYIKDRRSIIRKQAEIAIVTLKDEGINYFLDNTHFKISEWQQLKLIDVLRNKKDFEPPAFKSWLISSNKHAVLFSLRLIKHYNQNNAEASVIELVKHNSDQIKSAAISCIKDFNFKGGLDNMKLVFWNSSTTAKISILDAIAHLGSEEDLEFLSMIDKKESNFLVKSKALSSINKISPETIMPFKGIQKIAQYEVPDDIETSKIKSNEGETELFDEWQYHDFEDPRVEEKPKETEHLEPEEELLAEIKVDTEVIETKNDIQAQESEITVEEAIHNEEAVNLNFLPFVVEEEEKTVAYAFDTNQKPRQYHINEIEVFFETVSSTTLNKEIVFDLNGPSYQPEKIDEIDEAELYFLPVVVENDQDSDCNSKINVGDINVYFNEIKSTPDTSQELLSFDLGAINEPEEKVLQPIELDLSNYGIASSTNEFVKNETAEIKNCEVVYEEVDVETEPQINPIDIIEVVGAQIVTGASYSPLMREGGDELDLSFIPSVPQGKVHQEIAENELVEFEIPKASISVYDEKDIEFDATTRQLLNDLEKMGDQREIPFLKELLENEKYEPFKEKINALILKFEDVNTQSPTNQLLKTFNVFEDLFRTSDHEAKMILLDEMYAIGNEDEFEFLEKLIHDDNFQIKNRAIEVLDHLKAKNNETQKPLDQLNWGDSNPELTNIMEELEISSSSKEDIFDLNFELPRRNSANQQDSELPPLNTSHSSYLLKKLNLITSKIMKRFNG
jgi:HEAT repeat protein